MSVAVDAVASRRRPVADPLRLQRPAPYSMSDADYHAGLVELSDEGLACTKAICNYVYETYGRFPGTVDTMHLMWFMQARHLDLEFYERFFKPGVCGNTHMAHMARWHS